MSPKYWIRAGQIVLYVQRPTLQDAYGYAIESVPRGCDTVLVVPQPIDGWVFPAPLLLHKDRINICKGCIPVQLYPLLLESPF